MTDLGVGAGAAGATGPSTPALAAKLVEGLIALGATVATGESVTGGRVVAALTSVPGSSAAVLGGVVAYSAAVKESVLGVDPLVLADRGPVCAEVAQQMARGASTLLGATYGVASTGEAGPESASGQSVGTVYVAVAGPLGTRTRLLELAGTRADIQASATAGALALLGAAIMDAASGGLADPRGAREQP